jgi:uncharacterized protein YjbI with pentapeptide repeats
MKNISKLEIGTQNGNVIGYEDYNFFCRLSILPIQYSRTLMWLYAKKAVVYSAVFVEPYLRITFATNNNNILIITHNKYGSSNVDVSTLYDEIRFYRELGQNLTRKLDADITSRLVDMAREMYSLRGQLSLSPQFSEDDCKEKVLDKAYSSSLENIKGNLAFDKTLNYYPIKLREIDFKLADLSEINLGNGIFKRFKLSEVNLSGSNLSETNFMQSDLTKANLSKTVLREANLWMANLSGANLSESDLSGANLSECLLAGTCFKGANLSKANLCESDFYFGRNDEGEPCYESSEYYYADLRDTDLREANLEEAKLIKAKLNRSNLDGANLVNINLCGSNLSGASLVNADLRGADLSSVNLKNANLSRADLSKADLTNTDLSGVNVSEAIFKRSIFTSTSKQDLINRGAIL